MDFKQGIYDGSGVGVTGSTDLKIKIKRDVDNWFFDFDDSTFKVIGHVSTTATFTQVNTTIVPGEYEYSQSTSSWNDGIYTAYYSFIGSPPWTDSVEFRVGDGVVVSDPLVALTANAVANLMDYPIDAGISLQRSLKLISAVLVGDMTKAGDVYTFASQDGDEELSQTVNVNDVARTISSSSSSFSSSSWSSVSFSSSSSSFSSSSFSSSSSSTA